LKSHTKEWLFFADNDLQTARSLLKSRRYIYTLFCCQQTIEKMLKALITERKDIVPPRLHNLVRLAQIAELVMSNQEIEFLDRLSDFYIKTRYPETIAKLQVIAKRERALATVKETERYYLWIKSLIEPGSAPPKQSRR